MIDRKAVKAETLTNPSAEDIKMKRTSILTALILASGVSANAADLPLKAPPMPVAAAWNWTGFYIGGNGGYSWGRSDTTVGFVNAAGVPIVPPAGSITGLKMDLNGAVAGGQIGANWQTGSWVLGLEADAQWSGQKGNGAFLCAIAGGAVPGACLPGLTFVPAGATGTTLALAQKLEWFGTARARAGVLVTPEILAYVTGGATFGSVKTSGTLSSFTPNGIVIAAALSGSDTNVGWTVGGGIEAHLGGNWTGKIEYMYMDLGTFTNTATVPTVIGANISSRVTDNIVRAGINYHFGQGPVVARY